MKKKTIRRFTNSPLFLHIQHQSTTVILLYHKFSRVKILPNAVFQEKKATQQGSLNATQVSQGKKCQEQRKGRDCTHFKILIPYRFPTQFVLSFTIKRHRIDKIQKSVKMFQFPILGIPRKLKILVKPLVRKVHNICNRRLLITTNIIELRKSLLESTAPTPQMMPKFNFVTNTNLELNGF